VAAAATSKAAMCKLKFRVGDRVLDRGTGRAGTVVHVYKEPEIRDQLVAVRFNGKLVPVAVHVNDLRKPRAGRRSLTGKIAPVFLLALSCLP
jgi:hypothetical protein